MVLPLVDVNLAISVCSHHTLILVLTHRPGLASGKQAYAVAIIMLYHLQTLNTMALHKGNRDEHMRYVNSCLPEPPKLTPSLLVKEFEVTTTNLCRRRHMLHAHKVAHIQIIGSNVDGTVSRSDKSDCSSTTYSSFRYAIASITTCLVIKSTSTARCIFRACWNWYGDDWGWSGILSVVTNAVDVNAAPKAPAILGHRLLCVLSLATWC